MPCPCSDNYVGGLGATVLANALAKNTSLRELYIKGNELGDTGVEALCKAFSGAASASPVLAFIALGVAYACLLVLRHTYPTQNSHRLAGR